MKNLTQITQRIGNFAAYELGKKFGYLIVTIDENENVIFDSNIDQSQLQDILSGVIQAQAQAQE